jgi:hypothetical protein
MTTQDKERIISAFYKEVMKRDMAIQSQFLRNEISFHEYQASTFPQGAMDFITKVIRETETEYA